MQKIITKKMLAVAYSSEACEFLRPSISTSKLRSEYVFQPRHTYRMSKKSCQIFYYIYIIITDKTYCTCWKGLQWLVNMCTQNILLHTKGKNWHIFSQNLIYPLPLSLKNNFANKISCFIKIWWYFAKLHKKLALFPFI